ncbi:6-phosphogluconolactonase [Belnapia rosea]|uniref:6-phosphogluconolactonase n=1 Tax=Belnapia rosea TaxID=938405 RepID=A0A1G6V2J4_9PROT|nr:6-phosphogluconolactonase [Belnapia rosea]SDD47156.1 6-phosphogluconolactonase [Belnapia rosea]
MTQRIEVLADPEALARHVADWTLQLALSRPGTVAIALSGGSTPKRLYHLLAASPWRERMPWDRVHLFWGDERFVPADHPDSNQGMARGALIAHVPIPPANLHPVPVDGTPEEAARRYEAELRRFAATRPGLPLFDLQLLGLGPDGHTASLFPGTAALEERAAWAIAVIGAKPEPRITLTYPALENSAEVAFLVAGADKRAMLQRLREGDRGIPAGRLSASRPVTIFADRAAAP